MDDIGERRIEESMDAGFESLPASMQEQIVESARVAAGECGVSVADLAER